MDNEALKASLDSLAAIEPAFARTLAEIGYPGPRVRERGHQTLVQAIISQQVSIKAAASILAKVEAATGGVRDPENVARTSDEALRSAGLSRQKIAYLRSLGEDVLSGRLDFDALPEDDEEAIAALVHVKGIGRWTAEVYLLFAEGRRDIFPAGDSPSRSRSAGSSASTIARARRTCASWPNPGAPTEAPPPSWPGIIGTWCRSDLEGLGGVG